MPTRKTGTVTGASLEKSNRGKKGGLTGSKRVTGETTPIAETAAAESVLDPTPESTAVPTPTSVVEKLQEIASGTASAIEKGAQAVSTVQRYTSKIAQTVQGTDQDRNPSALTDGKVNTSEILARASADIDSSIPQMDSGTATQRNIVIARQRNFVGVAINNTRLKQDLATLDNEQKKLIGMLIDGKTLDVSNEKKAVTYHRAVVSRDTELSKLEQDRELLTQQQIRTEGTQNQTELIKEQEVLKVAKMREEIEKQGYEIQSVQYEKEKIKQETEAKFTAGF
jgi:hypothetical protein